MVQIADLTAAQNCRVFNLVCRTILKLEIQGKWKREKKNQYTQEICRV